MKDKVRTLYGIEAVHGNYATLLDTDGRWYVYNCYEYFTAGSEGCYRVLDTKGYKTKEIAEADFMASSLYKKP